MTHPTRVIAYHGCDISVRDRLIRGRMPSLTPRGNTYDWLGAGAAELAQNRRAHASDAYFLLRNLDRATSGLLHALREGEGMSAYDAVRGAFHQGGELASGSGFHAHTHVQIAVRQPDCVVGWFLPQGEHPLLDDQTLAEAVQQYDAANEVPSIARKPRIKAAPRGDGGNR